MEPDMDITAGALTTDLERELMTGDVGVHANVEGAEANPDIGSAFFAQEIIEWEDEARVEIADRRFIG